MALSLMFVCFFFFLKSLFPMEVGMASQFSTINLRVLFLKKSYFTSLFDFAFFNFFK